MNNHSGRATLMIQNTQYRKGREPSRPFTCPKSGEEPPHKLRDSKQRKGFRKNSFEESLQEYTCERTVKSNFSIDMG